VEAEERRNPSEGLFGVDVHACIDIGQRVGAQEKAAEDAVPVRAMHTKCCLWAAGFCFYLSAVRQRRQDGIVCGVFYGEAAAVGRAAFLIVDPGMVEDQVTAVELQHQVLLRRGNVDLPRELAPDLSGLT
jgi:hypothetical protein